MCNKPPSIYSKHLLNWSRLQNLSPKALWGYCLTSAFLRWHRGCHRRVDGCIHTRQEPRNTWINWIDQDSLKRIGIYDRHYLQWTMHRGARASRLNWVKVGRVWPGIRKFTVEGKVARDPISVTGVGSSRGVVPVLGFLGKPVGKGSVLDETNRVEVNEDVHKQCMQNKSSKNVNQHKIQSTI